MGGVESHYETGRCVDWLDLAGFESGNVGYGSCEGGGDSCDNSRGKKRFHGFTGRYKFSTGMGVAVFSFRL